MYVYTIFRQNFSDKNIFFISFAISEKTLAETIHYIPKVLRKGHPFHGPLAQLSNIDMAYTIYTIIHRFLSQVGNVVGSNIRLGILSQLVEFAKLPCPGLVQLHQIIRYEIMRHSAAAFCNF